MFRKIAALHARGIAVLLVEHNVAVSLRVSQRGYVLENGRVVMSGTVRLCSGMTECGRRIWAIVEIVAVAWPWPWQRGYCPASLSVPAFTA
jgi:Fe-S cluster assembly ATPase SufC